MSTTTELLAANERYERLRAAVETHDWAACDDSRCPTCILLVRYGDFVRERIANALIDCCAACNRAGRESCPRCEHAANIARTCAA